MKEDKNEKEDRWEVIDQINREVSELLGKRKEQNKEESEENER